MFQQLKERVSLPSRSNIQDFFADWEGATGCADANQDGGIDGSDVQVFFAEWEAGGC